MDVNFVTLTTPMSRVQIKKYQSECMGLHEKLLCMQRGEGVSCERLA
jgi:hypothetical protein